MPTELFFYRDLLHSYVRQDIVIICTPLLPSTAHLPCISCCQSSGGNAEGEGAKFWHTSLVGTTHPGVILLVHYGDMICGGSNRARRGEDSTETVRLNDPFLQLYPSSPEARVSAEQIHLPPLMQVCGVLAKQFSEKQRE